MARDEESTVYYCHGLPGSGMELDLALVDKPPQARPQPLDRTSYWREYPCWRQRNLAAFDAALAGSGGGRCRLIGFSLGAMAALHLAAARPEAIEAVDLISPAAPLELGDFLPRMAGRAVFSAAIAGDLPLALLGQVQRLMLSAFPAATIRTMFASASASERELLRYTRFQAALRYGLGRCLGNARRAYENELRTYVTPWAHLLGSVKCPIRLWHGDEDAWAPPDMSDCIARQLGSRASVTRIEGAGHFGALYRGLPAVLEVPDTGAISGLPTCPAMPAGLSGAACRGDEG